jgi:hypothetical protein
LVLEELRLLVLRYGGNRSYLGLNDLGKRMKEKVANLSRVQLIVGSQLKISMRIGIAIGIAISFSLAASLKSGISRKTRQRSSVPSRSRDFDVIRGPFPGIAPFRESVCRPSSGLVRSSWIGKEETQICSGNTPKLLFS